MKRTAARSPSGDIVHYGWPNLDIRVRCHDESGQPWGWLDRPLLVTAYQALHDATPTGPGAPSPWEIALAGTAGTHPPGGLPPRARLWASLVLIDPEQRQDRRCHHAFRPVAEAAWAAYAALSDAFGSSEMFLCLRPRQGRKDMPVNRLLALARNHRQAVIDRLAAEMVSGGVWAAPLLARLADAPEATP